MYLFVERAKEVKNALVVMELEQKRLEMPCKFAVIIMEMVSALHVVDLEIPKNKRNRLKALIHYKITKTARKAPTPCAPSAKQY